MKVFEFYNDKKNFYLVTEYCEGGELFDMIVKCKTFTEKTAASIMKQVFTAVAFVHSENIVHR